MLCIYTLSTCKWKFLEPTAKRVSRIYSYDVLRDFYKLTLHCVRNSKLNTPTKMPTYPNTAPYETH